MSNFTSPCPLVGGSRFQLGQGYKECLKKRVRMQRGLLIMEQNSKGHNWEGRGKGYGIGSPEETRTMVRGFERKQIAGWGGWGGGGGGCRICIEVQRGGDLFGSARNAVSACSCANTTPQL